MLEVAIQQLGGYAIGEAKIPQGFNLPCRFVVHTVSPIGNGTEVLASCYTVSLKLAMTHHCHSIAFPLISSGAHGCPKAVAMEWSFRQTITVIN